MKWIYLILILLIAGTAEALTLGTVGNPWTKQSDYITITTGEWNSTSIRALFSVTDSNMTYDNTTGIFGLNLQNIWTWLNTTKIAPNYLSKAEANAQYLNLSGTNANQNINISPYNITVKDVIIPSIKLNNHYGSVNDYINLFTSAGRLTGGNITDKGDGTVNVSAGVGIIRIADDDVSQMKFFSWEANGSIPIPAGITYIGVEYNSGNPKVVARTTDIWNYDTDFPLGTVLNQSGDLYPLNDAWWVGDGLTNVIERFQGQGTERDEAIGGLILGYTGTRNPTLTAGQLWARLNEFPISAVDCSGADNFTEFYRDGAGGWTKKGDFKAWNNTYYDDNSGTLTTLNNNYYANIWVFITTTEGRLMLIYPQNQYSNIASAEAEAVPTFPSAWYKHGNLVGRILFKQGQDAPIEVQSVYSIMFSASQVSNHATLSNLDYANSGHTGFASSTQLIAVNTSLQTEILNRISNGTYQLNLINGKQIQLINSSCIKIENNIATWNCSPLYPLASSLPNITMGNTSNITCYVVNKIAYCSYNGTGSGASYTFINSSNITAVVEGSTISFYYNGSTSAGTTYTAGANISLAGNVISINISLLTIQQVADSLGNWTKDKPLYQLIAGAYNRQNFTTDMIANDLYNGTQVNNSAKSYADKVNTTNNIKLLNFNTTEELDKKYINKSWEQFLNVSAANQSYFWDGYDTPDDIPFPVNCPAGTYQIGGNTSTRVCAIVNLSGLINNSWLNQYYPNRTEFGQLNTTVFSLKNWTFANSSNITVVINGNIVSFFYNGTTGGGGMINHTDINQTNAWFQNMWVYNNGTIKVPNLGNYIHDLDTGNIFMHWNYTWANVFVGSKPTGCVGIGCIGIMSFGINSLTALNQSAAGIMSIGNNNAPQLTYGDDLTLVGNNIMSNSKYKVQRGICIGASTCTDVADNSTGFIQIGAPGTILRNVTGIVTISPSVGGPYDTPLIGARFQKWLRFWDVNVSIGANKYLKFGTHTDMTTSPAEEFTMGLDLLNNRFLIDMSPQGGAGNDIVFTSSVDTNNFYAINSATGWDLESDSFTGDMDECNGLFKPITQFRDDTGLGIGGIWVKSVYSRKDDESALAEYCGSIDFDHETKTISNYDVCIVATSNDTIGVPCNSVWIYLETRADINGIYTTTTRNTITVAHAIPFRRERGCLGERPFEEGKPQSGISYSISRDYANPADNCPADMAIFPIDLEVKKEEDKMYTATEFT